MIWEQFGKTAEAEYQKKLQKWEVNEEKRRRKKPNDEPSVKPERRMYPEDADTFLALAASLKVILARSIDVADLPQAQVNLQKFLHNFLQVSYDL